MVITHNLSAMNAGIQYGKTTKRLNQSSEKLGSGYRINRAADDAAGLTISEKMRSQIRGLNQADKNVQEGISLIQIADGAMGETQDILQRMNELAVKSANGTNTSADRDAIHGEIIELKAELDRVSVSTEFNTLKILDGSLQRTTTTTQSNQKLLEHIKGSWIEDAFTQIEAQTGWSLTKDTSIAIDIRDLGNKVAASTSYGVDPDVTISLNSYYMNDDMSYGASGPEIGALLADRLLTNQLTTVVMNQNTSATDIPTWFSWGLGDAIIGEEIQFGTAGVLSAEAATDTILDFDYLGDEFSKKTAAAGMLAIGYLHELDGDSNPGTNEWDALMNELKTAPNFKDAVQTVYGQSIDTIMTTMKQETQAAADLGGAALTTFFSNRFGYEIGDANADSLIGSGSVSAIVPNSGTAEAINDAGDSISYNGYNVQLTWPDYKSQNTMLIHLGTSANEYLRFGIGDMSAAGILGSGFDVDLSTQDGARESIAVIKEGIEYVSGERSRIGAIQNRLEAASRNLLQTSENTQAAESGIRDVDMAEEMVAYSKDKILQQAGQAMLAQANQQTAGVLSLLQ